MLKFAANFFIPLATVAVVSAAAWLSPDFRFFVLFSLVVIGFLGVISGIFYLVKRKWGEGVAGGMIVVLAVTWLGLGLWAGITGKGRTYYDSRDCIQTIPWTDCN